MIDDLAAFDGITSEEFCGLSSDEQERAVRTAGSYQEHDRLYEMMIEARCSKSGFENKSISNKISWPAR